MGRDDYTDMGGTAEVFLTTHWSLIEQAGKTEDDRNRALVGLLMQRYWKPVYCYLRRKGYDNEEAKDLTQGFFHQVVWRRDLIGKADQSKGRFRSFMLSALNHYVINVRESETARKRIPKERLVPLEMVGSPELPEALMQMAPEDSFNYAWVSTLLEDVLAGVEEACRQRELTVHWQIFKDRLLRPTLDGTNPPSMNDVCARYGIAEPTKASNMITTVKRLFQTALRKRVRSFVVSDEEVTGELAEIRRFFK